MACRRIFTKFQPTQALWSRAASGQTTGVDYLKPENDLEAKTHTGQVRIRLNCYATKLRNKTLNFCLFSFSPLMITGMCDSTTLPGM